MPQAALNVLRDAVAKGVNVSSIEVMAMDFSQTANPNTMGYNAVAALNASIDQVYSVYNGTRSRTAIAGMMGVIVLIGRNGSSQQIFTLDKDAPVLLNAAESLNINLLSFSSGTVEAPVSSSFCR